MSEPRKTWDPHIVVFGWWIRFIWGITFNRRRVRAEEFYGLRLIAFRLWGNPNSKKCARLIGLQWKRAEPLED